MSDRARRLGGLVAALAAVSVWAGWIPVTRLGVVTRLAPLDVAALRFGVSGLILAPVLALRWREVPWTRWPTLAALVVGAGVPYQLLFGYGLAIANSGQAAVLGPGLVSSLVALLALVLLGERIDGARRLGLAVTLLGVATVVGHDALTGGAHIVGYVLILVACIHWAVYTIASRSLALRPVVNAAVVGVVNGAVILPIYLAAGGLGRLALVPAGEVWLQAVYQGVLTAVVALIAFAFAVGRLGAAAAASVMPLSPVLASLFGWLLLGDRVDGATAIGLAAVALGVVIANRRPRASWRR